MRPRSFDRVRLALLASVVSTIGCSNGSSNNAAPGGGATGTLPGNGGNIGAPSGGSPGAGGATSTQPANCTNVSPCGGDIVGTWNVTSTCLNVSGSLDPSLASMSCKNAPVTGSRKVTGTITINSDGTFSDNTTTTGTEQFTLPADCLVVSSTQIGCDQAGRVLETFGYASASCTTATGGGCSCSGTIQQSGGIAIVPFYPSASSSYTASNNVVTFQGDPSSREYSYCVSGNTMTWTPKSAIPTLAGTIVFEKQGGTTGTGGATSSGGATSTGGATNAGGATNTGGKAGSGGTTNAGGASTGGLSGLGGATSSGGASVGGKTGSGGTTSTGGGVGIGGANTGGSVGSGGTTATGGAGVGGSAGGKTGPCDVLATANTPCVAAHSTVRAMFANYSKSLYQVRKVSDKATKDIPLLAGTGIADASVQEAFCGTTSRACTISVIYDQTGNGNDLKVAEVCPTCSGCPSDSTKKGQIDVEAFADLAKITIAGHTAYGVRILPCGNGIPNQTGYRVKVGNKTAKGDQPESAYFVVDGVNTNSGCCFDYGNASTTLTAAGNMNAVEFSKNKFWGYGAGNGPWVAADLEAGVYAWNGGSGNWQNPNSISLAYPFVTALLKSNQNGQTGGPFVLKGGNAQSGTLTTMWDGARPNGYATLNKQGGIVLGIGGDNAAGAQGSFFEGAITASFNSSAADDALQANIVAAGYGK